MGTWVVSTQVPEAVCPKQAGDGPVVPSACVPSTATNAPARLRAVQTVKKPNLYHVPLHREKTEASPLDHERNSQVLFPVRLEEGFLGQARGAGTGLLGGRLSLGRPPKEAPPREARSEAASVERELSKCGPQTCCGAPPGRLCGIPVLRPHLPPAESEPRGWGTARWSLTRPPTLGASEAGPGC